MEIYLLATVENYRGRREYDLPEGIDHVAFRHKHPSWERIPLDSFPTQLRPNLLASTHDFFITRGAPSGSHVTVAIKREFDSKPTVPERFKGIKR